MKALASVWAALFAVVVWTASAQEPPALTDEQILSRSLAELKNSQVFTAMDQYSFTKHITQDLYHKNGKPIYHDDREYEYTPRPDGKTDIRLLSVKGSPPSDKELKQHEKEMHKMLSRSDQKVAEDKKKAQEEDTLLSEDFLNVYDFKLAGREEWKTVPAFLIEFTPKAEKIQVKVKSAKLLYKMAGHMWVSQNGFRILATEMHTLEGGIKVWGGFAGAINRFVARTEYSADTGGSYLPQLNSVDMDLRILLAKQRFTAKEEFGNFRKLNTKPAASATAP
jgi:hypothetical protein